MSFSKLIIEANSNRQYDLLNQVADIKDHFARHIIFGTGELLKSFKDYFCTQQGYHLSTF